MKLIVGGNSLIAKALAEVWEKDGIVFHASTRRNEEESVSRPIIDLESAIWPKSLARYDSAVICGGITNIDVCEQRAQWSWTINVENTVALALELTSNGVSVLFISSSQVFDGTIPFRRPSDAVCPSTEYGRQKVATEKEILGMDNSAVLRLPKVENLNSTLIRSWEKMLKQGNEIHPYKNIYISPVKIMDAVQHISHISSRKCLGLWHYDTIDQFTYADYAKNLCNSWGCSVELVKPIDADLSLGMHKYSSLSAG